MQSTSMYVIIKLTNGLETVELGLSLLTEVFFSVCFALSLTLADFFEPLGDPLSFSVAGMAT